MTLIVVLGTFVVLCLLAFWRPPVALAASMMVFAFEQWAQANDGFFVRHVSLINYLMGIVVLCGIASLLIRGRLSPKNIPAAGWCIFALYAWAVLSCLWSVDATTSIQMLKSSSPYIAIIALLTPLTMQSRRDVRFGLIFALQFGAFILLLLLFGTRVHEWGRAIQTAETWNKGFLVDSDRANPLAVASAIGACILLAMLLHFRGVDRIWQLLRIAILFVGLYLCFRSGSRGQLIAVGLVIIPAIVLSRGTKNVTAIASMVVLPAVSIIAMYIFYEEFGTSRRWTLEGMTKYYGGSRGAMVQELLSAWVRSSPIQMLFGLGSSASYQIVGAYPHFVPAEILGELGFIGFAIYCGILALSVRASYRLWKLSKDDPMLRGDAIAVSALVGFAFLLTLKQGSFLGSLDFVMYCFVLGVLEKAALQEKAKERAEKLRHRAMAEHQYRQSLGIPAAGAGS